MKALILFLSLMLTGQVLAADVGYEVEIIIFEDTTGVYSHAETLTQPEKSQQDDTTTENMEPKPASSSSKPQYQLLDSKQYRLGKQAEKLVRNPDYRVLIHTAWKQPGLDRDQAFAIQLDSLDPRFKQPATETDSQDQGPEQSFIKGDITLVMSRYLHINASLQYYRSRPQSSLTFTDQPDGDIVSPFVSYPVLFERRMRSRELHYIDHPMVGMIVLATPFKIEPNIKPAQPAKTYKTL